MNTLILVGSSRNLGNSNQIAKALAEKIDANIMHLKGRNIAPYSYENEYEGDDFLDSIQEILKYDTIIFLTPVYWYAMSGLMKNFFDRITDCLKIHKTVGRQLRGKNMLAISCGSEDMEIKGFFVPFEMSAAYLGMNYLGDTHTWISDSTINIEVDQRLEKIATQLRAI